MEKKYIFFSLQEPRRLWFRKHYIFMHSFGMDAYSSVEFLYLSFKSQGQFYKLQEKTNMKITTWSVSKIHKVKYKLRAEQHGPLKNMAVAGGFFSY